MGADSVVKRYFEVPLGSWVFFLALHWGGLSISKSGSTSTVTTLQETNVKSMNEMITVFLGGLDKHFGTARALYVRARAASGCPTFRLIRSTLIKSSRLIFTMA